MAEWGQGGTAAAAVAAVAAAAAASGPAAAAAAAAWWAAGGRGWRPGNAERLFQKRQNPAENLGRQPLRRLRPYPQLAGQFFICRHLHSSVVAKTLVSTGPTIPKKKVATQQDKAD